MTKDLGREGEGLHQRCLGWALHGFIYGDLD